MNCPYCGGEMVKGYIQCRDGVLWCEKIRPVSALTIFTGTYVDLGNTENKNVTVAYRCRDCRKIIIDYSKD